MTNFRKDPDDKLDYGFDLSSWLPLGDTISASTWNVESPPDNALTINSPAATHDTTTTTVWVDGGTSGETYKIVNHVTTTAGREIDLTHRITVQAR